MSVYFKLVKSPACESCERAGPYCSSNMRTWKKPGGRARACNGEHPRVLSVSLVIFLLDNKPEFEASHDLSIAPSGALQTQSST